MAGANRYRQRWSTTLPQRRSRGATAGRVLAGIAGVLVVGVALYIFGIVGDSRLRSGSSPTVATTALVPPPPLLVIPPPVGAPQPFGTLPAVAPWTVNVPRFALSYRLSGPLTADASRADVYRITSALPTVAQVDELARKLHLTGPIKQPRVGMFVVDGNGTLTVDAKATVYAPPAQPPAAASVADDVAARSAARTWLANHDLLPPDTGNVEIVRGANTIEIIFHPKSLPEILSVFPGVRVRMDASGAVQQVDRSWPTVVMAGAYDLVSLDVAWAQVAGRGVAEMRLPAGFAVPPDVAATATIDGVSLAYALSTGTDGAEYLQPMYVFNGSVALPGGQNGAIKADVRVAVPAVRDTKQPLG